MNRFSEDFAPTEVKNISLQFPKKDSGVDAIKFGCVGSITGETTLRELIRRCAGVEVGKRAKPEKSDLTLTGHVPIEIFRRIFGLSNEGLKKGIYSYGTNSVGEEFALTADVIDEFGEMTKLIAFPRANSTSGLNFNITNGQDEVAEVELTFTAYPDGPQNDIYYEAFVSEIDEEDKEIIEEWHQEFNYELVELPEP